MFDFKSNKTTKLAAQIIGASYLAYGLFMMGIPAILLSLSIGLLVMGIHDSFELAVAATVISGIVIRMVPFRRLSEGYQTMKPTEVTSNITSIIESAKAKKAAEGFTSGSNSKQLKVAEGFQVTSPAEVIDRLAGLRSAKRTISAPVGWDGRFAPGEQPQGVLASGFAEGFANPKADTDATGTKVPTSNDSLAQSASSAPAPAASTGTDTVPPTTNGPKKTAAGFTSNTDGLFKLGEMPSDASGGPHIDAGTTILSAIENLKPDQLKNMTEDTRKLLDTQKSLLGMLEQMKPMLSDGSQLLNSFNTMFGKDGASPLANFKLG